MPTVSSCHLPNGRWNQIYDSLFGSASPAQLRWRLGVDAVMANVALLGAVILHQCVTGGLSFQTGTAEIVGKVGSGFTANILPFLVFVIATFCGTKLYRPLPSGNLQKRLIHIGRACAVGAIAHLGVSFLFSAAPSRTIVVTSWGLLFGLTIVTRLSRIYFSTRFRVTRRNAASSSRVEDVLIVGGAGYIGSVLTRQLLSAGYRVRVLDLQLFGPEALNAVATHPRLELLQGDFRNVEDVVRALRGMDAVVHLAAIVGDPACAIDEETTIAVNYEAAKMMAQLARANGISRFVFASTCSVYGASDDIINEESPLNPVSLYATTKIDAERALLEATDDDFQPTILRLATAYGWSHRPRFDLVANLLSAKAVTDKDISVFNGEQWRPFVNTRDIARAMVAVLEAPLWKVGGEIFNVGDNSQNYTIRELGKIVADAVPGTIVQDIRNEDDPRNYRVRFDKIERTLGYRASVSLAEGIQEIVDAVKSGQITDWRDPSYSNVKLMEASVLHVLKFPADQTQESPTELQATREFLRRVA